MPRFTFPLQPLLTARRRTEQVRQRAVAELVRAQHDLEDRLRRCQAQISDGKQQLRGGLRGVLDLGALRLQASQSRDIARRAQQLVLQLAGVHRRLERARDELRQAATQRRAVELLRERRFEQWKHRIDKAETAALDELAVQAAARRET